MPLIVCLCRLWEGKWWSVCMSCVPENQRVARLWWPLSATWGLHRMVMRMSWWKTVTERSAWNSSTMGWPSVASICPDGKDGVVHCAPVCLVTRDTYVCSYHLSSVLLHTYRCMYVVNTYMQQKMHTIMICTYKAYMHNALLLVLCM